MSFENYHQHFVCTHQQARALIAQHDRFWLGDCGCRTRDWPCARSGVHVCLTFNEEFGGMANRHPTTREQAEAVLSLAEAKGLVTRPLRSAHDPQAPDGIYHCCDDCCSYFIDAEGACAQGVLIAATDRSLCTDCGDCARVCYFKARRMEGDKLAIEREACYGCGLCAEACTQKEISMVLRPQANGV